MSYSAQSHQVEATCPSNLSKTTYETRYWDGTLDRLESAAQNGCLRCGFFAKCIARFAPGAFNKKNSFRVWRSFQLYELALHRDKKRDSLVLEIFRFVVSGPLWS